MSAAQTSTAGRTVQSIADCYRIADEIEGDNDCARSAINFAAYTAQMYRRNLVKLAWACIEKNSAKRRSILGTILMELQANNECVGDMPSRAALAAAKESR